MTENFEHFLFEDIWSPVLIYEDIEECSKIQRMKVDWIQLFVQQI